jgi:hypothetical protein
MALHFMAYNFCRIHKTLRCSPAMAAGITDKLWDVADLVRVIEEWEHGRLISHLREAMLHPLNQISRPDESLGAPVRGHYHGSD